MLRNSISGSRVFSASILANCLALAATFAPAAARAQDFSLKIEPGLAIPLSAPQSRIYDVGGSESMKALFGLGPYVDIGPAASFTMLPAAKSGAESGVIWALGGGIRIKRPHDRESSAGISPWIDADMFYMRTGELNRPGFDAAVGLAVPIGRERNFWLGPFARYMQTLQPTRVGFDNRDARILVLGLSFEAGTGIERAPERVEVLTPGPIVTKEIVVTKEVIVPKDVPYCADQDKDGVPDSVDRCPDVPGTIESFGCPKYEKVVVGVGKLEVKEKVYFAFDKATLKPASNAILDQVVRVLADNKSFHVQVEGHTDSFGTVEHNQTLSDQRAAAVVDYLVAHGIPKERLESRGFASTVPLDTNDTAAGRENNRRVEFLIKLNTANAGSTK